MEDYLGLHKKHEEVTSQRDKLKEESSGFEIQITQLSGYRDAALAKASCETQEAKRLEDEVKKFENALSAAVERFKKSPEFLDTLGANAAYGAYNFVKKYKEKYHDLRSDHQELQVDYNSSLFAELSLDAPSEKEDEEDEEGTPLASDATPKA
ncbi:hypothetical protein LIER_10000 [Lithospermum erythrorhizon]|uniref:Uncharacterized protein n=1 Tax=Lithospermum erythrorhizon TaxID=34254 RepID=A0AAV3PHV8_LITER